MTTNTNANLTPAGVSSELRRTFISPLSILWLLAIAFPIYWVSSRNALFAYPISAFGTAMSSPVSLALPLIAVGVFLFRFSREIQERFLPYTRGRRSIVRTLLIKQSANAISVFLVFFLYAACSFIYTVWIAPSAGWLMFDRAGYGANYPAPEHFARLSEAWAASPAFYGLIYAAWCGLNGVVWSAFGFVALLLVPNRFVALSLPLIGCVVLSAATSLAGLDVLSPYTLWILFGYVQMPAATAVVPLAVLLLAAACLMGITIRRGPKLDKLQ